MKFDQLINKKFHILQRDKSLINNNKFIYDEIANRINHSIDSLNISIKNCLEIGNQNNIVEKFLISKFPNLNFFLSDISFKILNESHSKFFKLCFDNDHWPIRNNYFDLIVSNCYLHLSNNITLLFNNIYKSLNKDGFFIATIPGKNTHQELKDCMMKVDLDLYKGVYQRFSELKSIEEIKILLEKNNFRIPVIDIDTIELRYKKFSKLLSDIRYLGHSNIYEDRKKTFEMKNYFKRVEEYYWKKYSIDNKLNLKIEIIYISGWK